MSMTDPIADLLTRIRNAQGAKHAEVRIPASKQKVSVLKVLKDEGFITDYRVDDAAAHPTLVVKLKYYQGNAVIDRLERVSKPGRRVYKGASEIPRILGGLGVTIVSTPKGVMSDAAARKQGQGGEILCVVA